MAESRSTTPGALDPEALLAVQRRNIEAFARAGQIVAEGMRGYGERQVGLVQEAMRELWGEIQTRGRTPGATAADPAEQLARMRAAFERVLAQVQELSRLLLKIQGEAMTVLNDAASANAQALGGAAPGLAELQRTVAEAMRNASRQVAAAIEEMRQRMAQLQETTLGAAATATGTAAAEGGRGKGSGRTS